MFIRNVFLHVLLFQIVQSKFRVYTYTTARLLDSFDRCSNHMNCCGHYSKYSMGSSAVLFAWYRDRLGGALV